ncbi:unnamed protein product, partial [Pocillopora meandrina]
MDKSPEPDEVLRSSKGRNNFQSLARLLISGGTALLREVFDIKCPPSNLPTTLQNPATKKLLKAAPLSKSQRDCLYPSPGMYGKSTDFEMTLLFRLLRTICGFAPPATGWDCLPSSTDHSFGADLARIKYYRNSIYGHVNENMEIADDEFSSLWREISEALVRIAGQISPAKAREWKNNAIDTFLKDPLTEEDKRHEQELQWWYQNDREVKKDLEKAESSMKHLEKGAQYLRQVVREEAKDIKDEPGAKEESIAEEVQRLTHDIKDKLGGKEESTAQEVQRLRQEFRDEDQDIKDRLNAAGQTNSSAGGQLVDFFLIRMQIDCGSIPDPHPQMVVTEVKCKAVDPVSSASLPLAGRREEEKAGVGSDDVVPNAQSVMNFIARKYFQTIDTAKPEELNGFLQYLSDVRKVLVLDAQPGSLILTTLCSSLEILDALWYDYCAGHLNNMVQKHLLTKDVLKKFDSTEMKLTITIEREEYIKARKVFLQGSGE